jgi:uncharacterized membrane protein (UPF0127 family)
VLGTAVGVADRWWPRLRGLLGRDGLVEGEGLLLTPCRSIHMFGMSFPLDVAFTDPAGTVVATYAALPPGGRTRWHREARHALELPAGTLAATCTRPGDTLTWAPATAAAPMEVLQ